jgi:hypothetical protein
MPPIERRVGTFRSTILFIRVLVPHGKPVQAKHFDVTRMYSESRCRCVERLARIFVSEHVLRPAHSPGLFGSGNPQMKDWLLHGAIEADEKLAMDLAGPGYHINRSNLLVLESKADMQKRGQASPDDGDAPALTFAQPVAPAERVIPIHYAS